MFRSTYTLVMCLWTLCSTTIMAVDDVDPASLKHLAGNGVLVNEDLYEEVNKIKNSPGKDIWLYGGAALTSSFINMNLVDEMALAVHPVLLGSGKSLFRNIPGRKALQLTNTKTYPNGLIMLSYKFLK